MRGLKLSKKAMREALCCTDGQLETSPSDALAARAARRAVPGYAKNERYIGERSLRLSGTIPDGCASITVSPRAWDAVLAHASRDETRANLSQLCIDWERGCLVATDGHTLCAAAVDVAHGAGGSEAHRALADRRCTGLSPIPLLNPTAFALPGMLTIHVWRTPGPVAGAHVVHLAFSSKWRGLELTGPVEDGNDFPPWTKVVPTRLSRTIRCQAGDLAELATRAPGETLIMDFGALAEGPRNSNLLRCACRNAPWEAKADLYVHDMTGEPHPPNLGRYTGHGINRDYLLRAASAFAEGETLRIHTSGDLDPFLLEDEQSKLRIVIMPVRV